MKKRKAIKIGTRWWFVIKQWYDVELYNAAILSVNDHDQTFTVYAENQHKDKKDDKKNMDIPYYKFNPNKR